MKPARSNAHGGTPWRGKSAHAWPLSSVSVSEFLFSLTFFSTAQKWFSPGLSHTRPVQSVSCQRMRTDKWAGANSTAPL